MSDDAKTFIAFLVVTGILFAIIAAQRRARRTRPLRGTGNPYYDGVGGDVSGAPLDAGYHHGWSDGGHHGGGHSGDGGGGHGGGDGGGGGVDGGGGGGGHG